MRSLAPLIARLRAAPPLPLFPETGGGEGAIPRARKEEGDGDTRGQPLAPTTGEHDQAERQALAAHYAAEPAERPYRPGDPDPLRDGLLASALARPPSWADASAPPPPGAWCTCCGRHHRSGGRWWREAEAPKGCRCWACHPAAHLAPGAVAAVRT